MRARLGVMAASAWGVIALNGLSGRCRRPERRRPQCQRRTPRMRPEAIVWAPSSTVLRLRTSMAIRCGSALL